MAFTRSGGTRSYVKYTDCEEGDILVEGWYVGEEMSKFKNQLYVFRQKADDSVVCLNAAGKLTKWLDDTVETGDLVQIIYKGKKTIGSGPMQGKEAHDFDFFIDLDHRKDMVAPNSGPAVKSAAPTAKNLDAAMDEGIL